MKKLSRMDWKNGQYDWEEWKWRPCVISVGVERAIDWPCLDVEWRCNDRVSLRRSFQNSEIKMGCIKELLGSDCGGDELFLDNRRHDLDRRRTEHYCRSDKNDIDCMVEFSFHYPTTPHPAPATIVFLWETTNGGMKWNHSPVLAQVPWTTLTYPFPREDR